MLDHDLAQPSAQSAAARWRERLGRAEEQPSAQSAAARWRERLAPAEAPAPTTAQLWRQRFSPAAGQPKTSQAPGLIARFVRALPDLRPISPTPALERAAGERPTPGTAQRGRPMFPDAQIPPALDPASPLMEACRVLRANLAAGHAGALSQLAVIAPAPEASCALIASGLALALAEEGNRTLLVDADLRAPVLHKLFAIEPAPGFADLVLANDLAELRPVQVTGHLYTLPAGSAGRSPAVLFRLPAIGRVTSALAQRFDVVIYHISGQWTMPDALVFAPNVGAAIFTVRAGRDSADQIRRMREPLERARVQILGFAMIGEAQE
ncbi:MAG TPA: CpsD/CapB family tyrosine-protein kinase [Roseiflexaceae bacterium]|nr:CpsD/CapB family tyrosine-protein kinase [Roseiflexaceae bacterium]